MYPLVFALLPNRQQTTYTRIFTLLKTEVQQMFNRPLAPATVQTDFEMAAIRATETEFPAADVKGCFFHYTQAIWRKTQDLGLAVPYKEDPQIQSWIRRAAGLPLLPLPDVQYAWMETMDATPEVARSQEFNDYMVTTWIDARFPLRLWNHHHAAGPRTNNNLVGFHARINRSLPHQHPNLYRFVDLIQGIEKSEGGMLEQINFGATP
ncbi:uncharacterized protein [Haliotis asinina]|uniref:uncharacterized protein n=1 Tax=Haliotis asinina TaxID=109174 RepID=UPI0035322459